MKNILYICFCLFLLCSCYGSSQQFAGTMIGAHVGGALGSVIFGGHHNHSGAVFGDVVGTIAGAAIGAAITNPDRASSQSEGSDMYQNGSSSDSRYDASSRQRRPSYKLDPVRNERSKAIADLKIKNLRFIDENRNRIINSNESCKLLFDVYNDGKFEVSNITPYIYEVNQSKHIYISDPSVIRHLDPGQSISYVIEIKTDAHLQPGKVTFCIELSDSEGLTIPCREFDLETSH